MRVPAPVRLLALLLCAALVIALLLETGVHALTYVRGACHPVCITRFDATLGWTNRPGSSGRHRRSDLGIDVTYRVDARGARAAEPPSIVRPAPGRVVVLGDSNGFGWGVGEDEHFAARLARLAGVEVLNLSVSGYGTDQELLRLLTEGIPYRPDIVVVQLTPNDLDDIRASMIGGRSKPYFTLEAEGLELHNVPVRLLEGDLPGLAGARWVPAPVLGRLARHSWAYAWINERLELRPPPAHHGARFSAPNLALFRALLARIRDAAAAIDAQPVVVHASREIREADAIPARLAVCDLSERFRVGEPALFSDDLHWNARGHRLVAEALAEWLTSQRFPAESPLCVPGG